MWFAAAAALRRPMKNAAEREPGGILMVAL
jgi:hypothetical protein